MKFIIKLFVPTAASAPAVAVPAQFFGCAIEARSDDGTTTLGTRFLANGSCTIINQRIAEGSGPEAFNLIFGNGLQTFTLNMADIIGSRCEPAMSLADPLLAIDELMLNYPVIPS